jgi:hypothetical protein
MGTAVVKQLLSCAMCVGMLVSAPALSTAQTRQAESQIEVSGTVEAVDHAGRTVTIRMQPGNLVTLDVPPTAGRFEQVKIGDTIKATYYDQVSIRMKPAGEPPVDRMLEPIITATPGTLPGATRTRQRVTTVTITGWDRVNKVVSFNGPNGTAYTRRLLDSTDPAIVEGLKAGDRVDVTRTEAVTVALQSTTTVTATGDELRHRFTASVLFGWDNQFSGKMIQQATGRTTGGAPINLDETTYDEVYGRIGMFKIGAGYRTTPRTEGVFNFVWSSSDAESEATPIGTVGANAQVPLQVNFTKYQYWGFEGGQRWFFARTRFTPFVGYLVGINRHQDIRGTFVNVPPTLTPGLAEQDGKFFEKSWAFSLGPTAGLLIGIGPFEVMAETQLRFMGGLSDVDWLVEEGLRDINSESSRWSFPILLGGRIRF